MGEAWTRSYKHFSLTHLNMLVDEKNETKYINDLFINIQLNNVIVHDEINDEEGVVYYIPSIKKS